MESLGRVGIDAKDILIIRNLYWEQKAIMRKDLNDSKPVEIRRGVSLYTENIFGRALDGRQCGIKMNSENIVSQQRI